MLWFALKNESFVENIVLLRNYSYLCRAKSRMLNEN